MLYHVTTERKAEAIKKRGKMIVGYTSSEREAAVCEFERETGLSREDPEFTEGFYEFYDDGREARAREDFDTALSKARPEGMPGHEDSLFFWPDLDKASWVRGRMSERNRCDNYVVLEADPSKIPCQCFAADADVAEDLFDEARKLHPSEYEPTLAEEEEWEVEEEMEKLAKEYYTTMKKYPDGDFTGLEILCPCDVPAKAIKRVR